jgi:hypothetical protein
MEGIIDRKASQRIRLRQSLTLLFLLQNLSKNEVLKRRYFANKLANRKNI